MDAKELSEKFAAKIEAAAIEKEHRADVAVQNKNKMSDDVEHCQNALEQHVIPFLNELQYHFGEDQFSFATQIDKSHRPVGVSFKIGDGSATNITTAFGNIVVTRLGDSGSSKGIAFVYNPEEEPYISNSGDLTREKIAKLVEMAIDNAGG